MRVSASQREADGMPPGRAGLAGHAHAPSAPEMPGARLRSESGECLLRMRWNPGGLFHMGAEGHYPEEAPVHRVAVDGFWMDAALVTNAEFRRTVEATGHVTLARVAPEPAHYPGAKPELRPGSLLFQHTRGSVPLGDIAACWAYVPAWGVRLRELADRSEARRIATGQT